ncbi:hypothetical protein [Streptomyces abikoensis]
MASSVAGSRAGFTNPNPLGRYIFRAPSSAGGGVPERALRDPAAAEPDDDDGGLD